MNYLKLAECVSGKYGTLYSIQPTDIQPGSSSNTKTRNSLAEGKPSIHSKADGLKVRDITNEELAAIIKEKFPKAGPLALHLLGDLKDYKPEDLAINFAENKFIAFSSESQPTALSIALFVSRKALGDLPLPEDSSKLEEFIESRRPLKVFKDFWHELKNQPSNSTEKKLLLYYIYLAVNNNARPRYTKDIDAARKQMANIKSYVTYVKEREDTTGEPYIRTLENTFSTFLSSDNLKFLNDLYKKTAGSSLRITGDTGIAPPEIDKYSKFETNDFYKEILAKIPNQPCHNQILGESVNYFKLLSLMPDENRKSFIDNFIQNDWNDYDEAEKIKIVYERANDEVKQQVNSMLQNRLSDIADINFAKDILKIYREQSSIDDIMSRTFFDQSNKELIHIIKSNPIVAEALINVFLEDYGNRLTKILDINGDHNVSYSYIKKLIYKIDSLFDEYKVDPQKFVPILKSLNIEKSDLFISPLENLFSHAKDYDQKKLLLGIMINLIDRQVQVNAKKVKSTEVIDRFNSKLAAFKDPHAQESAQNFFEVFKGYPYLEKKQQLNFLNNI